MVLTTDAHTFADLGRRTLAPADAIAAGRLTVEGDPEATARCAALFRAATAGSTARA